MRIRKPATPVKKTVVAVVTSVVNIAFKTAGLYDKRGNPQFSKNHIPMYWSDPRTNKVITLLSLMFILMFNSCSTCPTYSFTYPGSGTVEYNQCEYDRLTQVQQEIVYDWVELRFKNPQKARTLELDDFTATWTPIVKVPVGPIE